MLLSHLLAQATANTANASGGGAAPMLTTNQTIQLIGALLAIVLGLRGLFRLGDGPRNNNREQKQEREREADLKNRDGPPRFNG